MKTFTFSFKSKQKAVSDFRNICPEVMADGHYKYIHLYPNGQVEKEITIKRGKIA